MLITCASCGRRRTLEKRPRGRLRCTGCGSVAFRVIRKVKWWHPTAPQDGVGEHAGRLKTYQGLIYYAHHKGYKAGWAAFKFKAIFGVRPNGEVGAEPAKPSGELVHWIVQQAAAYSTAKRRERIRKENES